MKFNVINFHNPPTTALRTGFVISTLGPSGGTIDSRSGVSVRVTTAATLYDGSIASIGSTIVQSKAEFRVSFVSPVPLSEGCLIDVVFPDDFQISGSDLTNVRGMNLFGSRRELSNTINSSTRTVTITNG